MSIGDWQRKSNQAKIHDRLQYLLVLIFHKVVQRRIRDVVGFLTVALYCKFTAELTSEIMPICHAVITKTFWLDFCTTL